ncbi:MULTISPECIES: hypothetical protein [unclassified Bradyrhizobium]|uniref:hypothetical protein n=1 Tax=unclassified Bradyrhizobium TaxID=2631580 RepID=UPI0028F13E9D|nr:MULTISPECIES: hypothetical protein [unclassified Bradyrhizobium]
MSSRRHDIAIIVPRCGWGSTSRWSAKPRKPAACVAHVAVARSGEVKVKKGAMKA